MVGSGRMRSAPPVGALALLVALSAGCSRQPAQHYVERIAADPALEKEIAPIHRAQIAAYLDHFYGTPADPRVRVPAPAMADADGASDEAPPADEAESPAAPASEDSTQALAVKPPPIKIEVVDKLDRAALRHGREIYSQQCAQCHGFSGDGRGVAMIGLAGDAAHLNPPPRDYRGSPKTETTKFKFTTTQLGAKPRRTDLKRIVRYGAKGTSMPSFRWMPEEDLAAVLDYVTHLAYRGELELKMLGFVRNELTPEDKLDDGTVSGLAQEISDQWDAAESQLIVPLTPMLPNKPEHVTAGARAFVELNCVKCHRRDARGSKTADVGQDDWGRTAYPADLTMGTLHGGRRPVDIYRRIYSGINGTPMPGSAEPDSTKNETPEERSEKIWQLVQFVTKVIDSNEVPAEEQKVIDELMAAQGATVGAASSSNPSAP